MRQQFAAIPTNLGASACSSTFVHVASLRFIWLEQCYSTLSLCHCRRFCSLWWGKWTWRGALCPKDHLTHVLRVVTMKLWEPKRKCPKAVLRRLQTHVVWSRTLKRSVKSYVTGSPTKCYFNEFLFMRVFMHDKIESMNGCERSECHGLPTSKRWFLKIIQVTMRHDPFDAM